MTRIYSIDEAPLEGSFAGIPDFVFKNVGQEGYFTLLSVDSEDGKEDDFVGIAQFYVGMTSRGLYYAELVYIYVTEGFRHNEEGLRLVRQITQILKSQDVDVILTDIPYNEDEEIISDLEENEIVLFFRECGFIPALDDKDERQRLIKLTRR
ncbi:hypothetical protein [Butyrivibrio sp. FCS014]|uniref:hypothetical protein n=1 Tax=Butyrivibrio sp. FCS014 TaxID=1408304 RepID=UPI000466247D|nr:hypothetical protein [Butyrivibrio sp. FCS014]